MLLAEVPQIDLSVAEEPRLCSLPASTIPMQYQHRITHRPGVVRIAGPDAKQVRIGTTPLCGPSDSVPFQNDAIGPHGPDVVCIDAPMLRSGLSTLLV